MRGQQFDIDRIYIKKFVKFTAIKACSQEFFKIGVSANGQNSQSFSLGAEDLLFDILYFFIVVRLRVRFCRLLLV